MTQKRNYEHRRLNAADPQEIQRKQVIKRGRKPKNGELSDEELLADAMREALEWQERKKNGQIF